jgi:hypothetical protein
MPNFINFLDGSEGRIAITSGIFHLSVPKNQPMAMVWKKQTQRRAMPEAE